MPYEVQSEMRLTPSPRRNGHDCRNHRSRSAGIPTVCGEIEFAQNGDSAERFWNALDEASERLEARRTQELRKMRRALKLTQAQAGQLFGGGVSAFSAYEHGKTQPHKSTVLLLRLLSKHPQLLDEVRASAQN